MERKIVYQIYPSSFKDSNNDGIGDIKGIITKLPYLEDLGINYLWVSPIFKTNFKDNGYDIIDYLEIEKVFGNKQDLKMLIKTAKKHKIKIMLDMVFNHTSTDSEWFKKWKDGDSAYKDFYFSQKSIGKPPTNWKSKFGGSAWEEYKKNHWYLHLFDKTQADLNWDNPSVRQKLKSVIKYYIDLGVKGFRFDVINLVSKGQFIDDKTGDGRKFYTDGPNVHEFIREMTKEFPDDQEFHTVAELSSTKLQHAIQYGNKDKQAFDSVFTFHHLKVDYDSSMNKFIPKAFDPQTLNNVLKYWAENMQKHGSVMANFFNNHDQPRSLSRFIKHGFEKEGAKLLFVLSASLPGVPYLFQGEEIGMTNGDFNNINQFKDVETINYLKAHNFKTIPLGVMQKSRDHARTPMQWNDKKHAGFSSKLPWIKLNDNYKTINVAKQTKDPSSVLTFYKKYIRLLKTDEVLIKGKIKFLPFKNNIIAYQKKYQNQTYKFYFSFNSKPTSFKLSYGEIFLSNYQTIQKNILQPYQFIIIKKEKHE